MRRNRLRTAIGVVLFVLACTFLAAGAVLKHKVYDDDEMSRQFGLFTFRTISEVQLTVDATFSGTVRKDDKLFSTYDRSAPRGKKACPT